MTVVVTLEDYRPSPRYDGEPWTQARIEEAPLASGPWTTLETIPLVPVDADPENPAYRNFTTDLGTAEDLWYRIVFLDADASTGLPTIPVQNVEDDRPVYAATSELFRILKIRNADGGAGDGGGAGAGGGVGGDRRGDRRWRTMTRSRVGSWRSPVRWRWSGGRSCGSCRRSSSGSSGWGRSSARPTWRGTPGTSTRSRWRR